MNIITAFALVALQATSPQQFNLRCIGTMDMGRGPTPFEEVYRVDLDRRVFCRGNCSSPETIAEIGAAHLVLVQTRRGGVTIDRGTGQLSIPNAGVTAQCSREEFSGIPNTAF